MESPDWVRDGLTQLRDEIFLFVKTLWLSTVRPRHFTRAWLRRDLHALNPFGYLLTAIGFVSAVQTLAYALRAAKADEGTLGKQILAATLPPIYFLALGIAVHVFLWLLGLRRARLRETAAIALYTSGPAYVGHAALVCIVLGLVDAGHMASAKVLAAVLGLASIVAFVLPFIASLRELHDGTRLPWLRPVVAFVAVFVLSGFFFGAVSPPGQYGLHPTIRPPTATRPRWDFFFGTSGP